MAPKLDEKDVKQGRSGKPILIVLIAGTALIVIGYLIVGSIGVGLMPDSSLEQSETVDAADRDTTDVEGETVTPGESEPQQNNAVEVPE